MKTKKLISTLASVSMLAALFQTGSITGLAADDDSVRTTVEQAMSTETVRDSISLSLTEDDVEFSPWTGVSGGRGKNLWLIYQPLCWIVNGELTNCLIESYDLVDTQTVTAKLYEYITDSEGNAITASDVVYSYESAQAIGEVKGATYFDTVTAVDDYTVEFTFKKDLSLGELEQTLSQVYICSQAAFEASEDGMLLDPIGTGAYVLGDYTSGSSVTFVKNENYWQTDADKITVRDIANVNTITYYVISESTQRAIAVEEGTVDYADIGKNDVETVEASGKNVYSYMNTLTYYLEPNCSDDSVMNNLALRQAVFYAIDSEMLATGMSSTSAFAVYDLMCSNYVDYVDAFETEDNFYTNPSLETAAEYLAESGYSAGEVTLTLVCESSENQKSLATMVQALLGQIGINVEIQAVQASILSETLADSTQWDLLIDLRADNLYMVNAWDNLLSQNNYSWGGSQGFVIDDTLQELLETARGLDTHTEENILACHDYIVENAYIRGLVGYYSQYAYSDAFESLFYNEKGYVAPNCSTYNAD